MVAGLLAQIDQGEAERTGERVKRAKAAARDSGRLNGGGRRPFGFRSIPGGLEVVAAEAAVIREVVTRVLAGETLARIALDLNGRGVTTPGGGRWKPGNLARLLTGRSLDPKQPRLRNTTLLEGGASWPSILSHSEVAAVTAAIDGRRHERPTRPAGRRAALSGLLLVADMNGRSLFDTTGKVQLHTLQPNGPDCPPTAYVGGSRGYDRRSTRSAAEALSA